MSQFETVREILSVLNEGEKNTAATYLGVFIEKGKVPVSKSNQLFQLLVSKKNEDKTESEIFEMVYKTGKRDAFNRLLIRLRDKILESLIIDVNIKDEVYPVSIQTNIQVRKSLTQAQILLKRGARKCAGEMLDKVISLCKKYELYEELLFALRLVIRKKSLERGKKVTQLVNDYAHYDLCKNAVLRAELYYYEVLSYTDFKQASSIQVNWLKNALSEMRSDFKKTKSKQVGYYYYYIEAQFYQSTHNYKSARRSLLSVQRLLETGFIMDTPEILGGLYYNIGENDLFFNQFNRSYVTLEIALEYFKHHNYQYDQCVETMFYAKFYEGDFKEALHIILELLPEAKLSSIFKAGKRNYLLACIYFMMKDFSKALNYLKRINPIEEDEGWSTGIKMLEILTLIELHQFEESTSKIENFRRLPNQNHRIKIISSVLQSLSYSGYEFKSAYTKEKGSIEMLASTRGNLAWQMKSFEMVIFNQWIFAKAYRQDFAQKIPSFQIEKRKEKALQV